MADAVYLHIGAPKTGTSYLQKMLWSNRTSLGEQGIFLPLGRRRAHFDAVADLRGGIWAREKLSTTWDALAERVRTKPGVAVVSEELFCATPPEQVERVVASLAPVPVHVVYAARDVGRQVPAEWQQALRSRSPMTYEEWLRLLREDPTRSFWNVQDPVAVHRRWGAALEPGRFHVLTVPPPGAPSGLLWERFAEIIGVDPARAEAPAAPQNESLGLVEAELLRRFNARLGARFPLRAPYVNVVRDHLMRPALFGAPGAQRIGVPEDFAEWLVARGDQMVEELKALGEQVQVHGDVSDLAAAVTLAAASPDELSDGQLLEAALDAWVRQMEAVEADLDKVQEQRRPRVGDVPLSVATPLAERPEAPSLAGRVRGRLLRGTARTRGRG